MNPAPQRGVVFFPYPPDIRPSTWKTLFPKQLVDYDMLPRCGGPRINIFHIGKLVRMKYQHLALTAVLLAALFLLAYQITLPYGKLLEHGTLEIRARNFLQEGFLPLRFLPTRNLIGGRPNFYLNHPPLFVNFLALVLKTLGDSELSARTSVIIFSLGSVFLLYLIVLRETSVKSALWTALLAVLFPVFFYYGRVVNYEPAALFCSLLVIRLYLSASTENSRYPRGALFAAVILGGLSGWAFYFTPPALLLYALLRKHKILLSLGTVLIAAITFLFLAGFYHLAAGRWGGPLTVFGGVSRETALWLNPRFYRVLAERAGRSFTYLGPFLAAGGAILILGNLRKRPDRKIFALSCLFLVSGAGLVIAAPKDVFNHDWGLFMLIPAAAFLSAQFLCRLRPAIRVLPVSVLVILSAVQFKSFHGTFSASHFRAGKMIRDRSRPGDTLLAVRGTPLAYYAGIPTQFHWPGPPSVNVIRAFRPAWVVLRADREMYLLNTVEEIYNCLAEEGYRLFRQDGYFIWRRGDPSPPTR